MKVLLIDGLNLVRRIFSAVSDDDAHVDHDGRVTELIMNSLNRALVFHQPTHAVGVFDGQGESWRHKLFPSYKSGRPPMPVALVRVLPTIVSSVERGGVNCLAYPGYEADDLLASVATKVASRGGDVVILSTDTGLCQILDPRITVFDHFSNEQRDERFVWRRFNVHPSQLVDFLALVGVPSSSIPGVRGIGPKTAVCLLSEFNDLDSVLAAAPKMLGRKGRLLRDQTAQATLSRRLVRLSREVELGVSLSQFRVVVDSECNVTIARKKK